MSMGTQNFGDLLWPGLNKIYGDSYNAYPEQFSKILNVQNSKMAYEESLSVTGFGMAPTKPQGESVKYAEAKQNWKGRITHVTYGLGFKVTDELYEDAQYKIINNMPAMLARSVRVTQEVLGANVLNRAFDSNYKGPDGLELCSNAHLLGGGGTWSNLGTAADLSETSLEQALIDIGNYVDDKGLPIQAIAKKLVIHPANQFNAAKLLKSTQEYDTANNAINPMYQIMPYEINNYLTDTDAWFILTDVPNGLVWYWRRKDKFGKDGDFDAELAKFKTTFRCSAGWDDARGIYGNAGV